MSEQDLVRAFNDIADALNQAAATLQAIGRAELMRNVPSIDPRSPLAVMAEQAKRFARILPGPGEPTSWRPPDDFR